MYENSSPSNGLLTFSSSFYYEEHKSNCFLNAFLPLELAYLVLMIFGILLFTLVYCIYFRAQTITKRFYIMISLLSFWISILFYRLTCRQIYSNGIVCGIFMFAYLSMAMSQLLYTVAIGVTIFFGLLGNTTNESSFFYNRNPYRAHFLKFELWLHLFVIIISCVYGFLAASFGTGDIGDICFIKTPLNRTIFLALPLILIFLVQFLIFLSCVVCFFVPSISKSIDSPRSIVSTSSVSVILIKEFIVYITISILVIVVWGNSYLMFLFPYPTVSETLYFSYTIEVVLVPVVICLIYVVFNISLYKKLYEQYKLKKYGSVTTEDVDTLEMDEMEPDF